MQGRRMLLALLALAAPTGIGAASSSGAPARELTWESYERLRDQVLPAPGETEWLGLGWRPTLWQGVREAQAQRRPLVLWAMNGHPLGCT